MGAPLKVTNKEIEEALLTHYGNISKAARSLGVARETVSRRMKRNERLKRARSDGREDLKDVAEGVLANKIINGETTAVIFYLKTQAKDRGYTERQELSGPDNGPMVIKGYTNVSPDEWGD